MGDYLDSSIIFKVWKRKISEGLRLDYVFVIGF